MQTTQCVRVCVITKKRILQSSWPFLSEKYITVSQMTLLFHEVVLFERAAGVQRTLESVS